MRFEDRDDGEYRIHAGSLELRAGQGYLAAVIVDRLREGRKFGTQEVYRDVEVCGGHRWSTSEQALRQALILGASAVAAERHRALGRVARSSSSVREVV